MKFRFFLLAVMASLGLAAGSVRAQTSVPPPQPPASAITAAPAQAAPAGDIRDIRGPITIPYPLLWVAYLAAALLLAGLGFAAWRHFRRRVKIKARLPFEIALDRLEAARPLMNANSVREYAIAVSETIRAYIEQAFHERAAHRTTEEFLSDLLQQSGTPLAHHQDRLADFLQHCDLTKFARWQLSATDMEAMHESARAFVLDTRPQPEAVRKSEPPVTASAVSAAPTKPELAEAQ